MYAFLYISEGHEHLNCSWSVFFVLLSLLFTIIIISELGGCTVHFGLPIGQSLTDGLKGQRCVAEDEGQPGVSAVLVFIQQSQNDLLACYSGAGREQVPTSTQKA